MHPLRDVDQLLKEKQEFIQMKCKEVFYNVYDKTEKPDTQTDTIIEEKLYQSVTKRFFEG